MSETGPHDNSRQDLTENDKTIIYVCVTADVVSALFSLFLVKLI